MQKEKKQKQNGRIKIGGRVNIYLSPQSYKESIFTL
jgi:hypothetical protein